jgi:23S rRNA (uracil1939-C5)-methyltransferase
MDTHFNIESIDPLGQGVFKASEGVTFIKKTLPGESGIAEIISEKKGVRFARLKKLEEKSSDRISPACPHFDKCNGCDFLHTSYEKEVEFKEFNIKRQLQFLKTNPPITYHRAKKRTGYRNRVQLHYDKKLKKIGFFNSQNKIVDVENCIIASPLVHGKLKEILLPNNWQALTKSSQNQGHIELYEKNNSVEVNVNQKYASGGFTQVNPEMNEELKKFLVTFVQKVIGPNEAVFDLFGGNGNLTALINNPTLVVDIYDRTPSDNFHQRFLNLDLYNPKAIAKIAHFYPTIPGLIIFDPPRSGLKNLSEFIAQFKPKKFILINCEFSSFLRDVRPILPEYELSEVHIFDLFPSTHHFETIGLFTMRN